MTTKEFLNQAAELNRQIHFKELELESFREMAAMVSCGSTGERLSGTKNPDPPFVRYTDKALTLEKEIQQDKQKAEELKCAIDAEIQRLDDINQRTVLRYRYLMFLSWKDISGKMGYSRRWLIKIHDRAVLDLEKIQHISSHNNT